MNPLTPDEIAALERHIAIIKERASVFYSRTNFWPSKSTSDPTARAALVDFQHAASPETLERLLHELAYLKHRIKWTDQERDVFEAEVKRLRGTPDPSDEERAEQIWSRWCQEGYWPDSEMKLFEYMADGFAKVRSQALERVQQVEAERDALKAVVELAEQRYAVQVRGEAAKTLTERDAVFIEIGVAEDALYNALKQHIKSKEANQ